MRASWLPVLAAALLAGCGAGPGALDAAPALSTCTTGYSNQIDIHLSNPDDGRSITANLCDAIDVVLLGRTSSQWQSIDSSDEGVLKVVPLPLPAPPPGGAHDIYLAQQTGTAVLSSVSPTCRWSVTVTVVR